MFVHVFICLILVTYLWLCVLKSLSTFKLYQFALPIWNVTNFFNLNVVLYYDKDKKNTNILWIKSSTIQNEGKCYCIFIWLSFFIHTQNII